MHRQIYIQTDGRLQQSVEIALGQKTSYLEAIRLENWVPTEIPLSPGRIDHWALCSALKNVNFFSLALNIVVIDSNMNEMVSLSDNPQPFSMQDIFSDLKM